MTSHIYFKQFEFEFWSNTQILNSLKSMQGKEPRAELLFSHLLSSHSMWLSRVNKTEMTGSLFQERTLSECEALMQSNLEGWKLYLSMKTDLELQSQIEFLSAWESSPSKRCITIKDAIIHLINHSSYHRGQIVAMMKDHIQELPLSTYIMYASIVIQTN